MTTGLRVQSEMHRYSSYFLLPLIFALATLILGATATASDIRDNMSSIARVAPMEEPVATDDEASFSVRVYKEDDAKRRYRHKEDDFIAVDVTNYLDICSDGQAQVRAISIGSWQFDLDGDCAGDALNSNVSVIWDQMLTSQ